MTVIELRAALDEIAALYGEKKYNDSQLEWAYEWAKVLSIDEIKKAAKTSSIESDKLPPIATLRSLCAAPLAQAYKRHAMTRLDEIKNSRCDMCFGHGTITAVMIAPQPYPYEYAFRCMCAVGRKLKLSSAIPEWTPEVAQKFRTLMTISGIPNHSPA